ncbi:hypothetical protein K439DRAFT_896752 [Ramaria rubella]|nr:hypothetical protein K439DRAFT_896752 [Ramaria rubella]
MGNEGDTVQNQAKATLTNKGRSAASGDVEHTARLIERRDRKRFKRAMVEPIGLLHHDGDKSSNECDEKGKKINRHGARKKTKVDFEFTLMRSFLATNIGKERLTVRFPVCSSGIVVHDVSLPAQTTIKHGSFQ